MAKKKQSKTPRKLRTPKRVIVDERLFEIMRKKCALFDDMWHDSGFSISTLDIKEYGKLEDAYRRLPVDADPVHLYVEPENLTLKSRSKHNGSEDK